MSFLVRSPDYNGWRIVHEIHPKTRKPFCGHRLKNYWVETEQPTFADGEDCERCAKARDNYESKSETVHYA